jgi:hypothetical protein
VGKPRSDRLQALWGSCLPLFEGTSESQRDDALRSAALPTDGAARAMVAVGSRTRAAVPWLSPEGLQ